MYTNEHFDGVVSQHQYAPSPSHQIPFDQPMSVEAPQQDFEQPVNYDEPMTPQGRSGRITRARLRSKDIMGINYVKAFYLIIYYTTCKNVVNIAQDDYCLREHTAHNKRVKRRMKESKIMNLPSSHFLILKRN